MHSAAFHGNTPSTLRPLKLLIVSKSLFLDDLMVHNAHIQYQIEFETKAHAYRS